MKELKRVYEQLCLFADKVKITEKLKCIKDEIERLRDDIPSWDEDKIKSEEVRLKEEQERLKKCLQDIKTLDPQHIRIQDTAAAFKSLGKKASKREIMDMMWEVDEKLDNVIDWEEFRLMFARNIHDTTGLEPSSFYHMVQFMIYDRDNNGKVSIDETMNMLYARVGREKMESTISKLFGDGDGSVVKEEGHQGGEINFTRYCQVVEKEQMKSFQESEMGKTLLCEKKSRGNVKRISK